MSALTLSAFKMALKTFVIHIQAQPIAELYGVSDGKAIGTYVERALKIYLAANLDFEKGNAASGIDFPSIEVDLKVTSIHQPQSSAPFRSAHQKIYGLGYHLVLLVYSKADNVLAATAHLLIEHAIFIEKERTADYQTTRGLLDLLERDANQDDISAFLEERYLPLDEVGRQLLAEEIVRTPPQLGYLTISNALQWRLQYSRVIQFAYDNTMAGVENLMSHA